VSHGLPQVRHIVSNLTHGTGATTGETMYFGSPQSQTLLRIYDKRLEMQSKERENWQDYGVRWELELKKDRAEQCARALASLDETDWKEFVVGLLRSYVDFRQITKETEEEDRYRAPMLEWYALLTEGFQKGRLAQEKQVQTLQNVKRWVSECPDANAGGHMCHPWRGRMATARNCQGHLPVERPAPELAQATTQSDCHRSAGGHAGSPC
jgi:phage replication initiation protein